MKPLGSDGKPIPKPPELLVPWQTRVRTYVRQSLALAAAVLAGLTVELFLRYRSIVDLNWAKIGRGAAFAFPIAAGCGVLAIALCGLVAAAISPWTRRDFGRKLERLVASLGADQLDQEITRARAGLDAAPSPRLRSEWQAWLAWLEAHKSVRLAAGAPERPDVPPIAEWSIRPAIGPQVGFACLGLAFIGFAVWGLVDTFRGGQPDWLSVIGLGILGAIGALFLGALSTLCIKLTPTRLTARSFWRTFWSVDRANAEIREGVVRRNASVPGYRVFDRKTGKQVGDIARTFFRAADLEKLAALFPPR